MSHCLLTNILGIEVFTFLLSCIEILDQVKRIYIPLPDENVRKLLLRNQLKGRAYSLPSKYEIITLTANFSNNTATGSKVEFPKQQMY